MFQLETLLKTERYFKDSNSWFYSSRDPRYELSNMGIGFPLWYRDIEWKSSEHLYQATKYQKDTVFNLENVIDTIYNAKTPMASKIAQKCAVDAGLVRHDWEQQNIKNMLYILILKLHYNYERLSAILDKTEGTFIIEVSKRDSFWGCKMQYSHSGTMLIGYNVLGKL